MLFMISESHSASSGERNQPLQAPAEGSFIEGSAVQPAASLSKAQSPWRVCEVITMPAVRYLQSVATHLMDVIYLHLTDEEKWRRGSFFFPRLAMIERASNCNLASASYLVWMSIFR